jgi:lactoylglutathione lyase
MADAETLARLISVATRWIILAKSYYLSLMKPFYFAIVLQLFSAVAPAQAVKDTLQKPRINHLALYVHDLAKSTRFYETILGLDSIPEPFRDGKHKWLRMGPGSALHLIAGAPAGQVYNKNTHICFTMASVNRFTAVLKQHSIEYEDWPGNKGAVTTRVDGVHQIYFRDPDGFWIEVNDAR